MRALILPVLGKMPNWGEGCFFAPNATIVGDVKMGDQCTVWFNAVVRGDVNAIEIGSQTNIQDGAIIHCTYQKAATKIGSRVSIGHAAIVHGCTIHDDVLIGMGAKILDHAIIQQGCIIAAGAVVLEHMICERGYLYAGIPAKKIKPITAQQHQMILQTAQNYLLYSTWF